MDPAASTSPTSLGKKRPRPSVDSASGQSGSTAHLTNRLPQAHHHNGPQSSAPSSSTAASSSFRNVSACNRCRLRKNRCDQRLPRCQACEKARVRCVGYDPITKREIPRSYVYFLESRVTYLEKLLIDHNVQFRKAVAFDEEEAIKIESGSDTAAAAAPAREPGPEASATEGAYAEGERWHSVKTYQSRFGHDRSEERAGTAPGSDGRRSDHERDDDRRLDNLVSNISMVSVQGTSDPRYLGSASGISFARVVFAAVKSSVSGNGAERGIARPKETLSQGATGTGGSTMRDSFFGLHKRPTMNCAAFPDRDLAERLVDLYFEHANPQIPILHRGEFMELLDRTYTSEEKNRSARTLYTLNIVFAIGAGIILEDKQPVQGEENRPSGGDLSPSLGALKRQKLSSYQYQPEEYHASAIVHLESFLGSSSANDAFGGLEELQAVLLLASFALLRPVAPGLWYIVGVAMRLAVDLGLHYEDGTGIDTVQGVGVDQPTGQGENTPKLVVDSRERGRREWVRDLRRRLWWCVYSFDRLVATCVGRPFGIADSVITTDFPSVLDDRYITKAGFLNPPDNVPSYKRVAHHYFRLRLLQSEIQDVLQYRQARFARQRGCMGSSVFLHSELWSPFLQGFDSFRSWRKDVHHRLDEWIESAPSQQETGVRFPVGFLELNYWQAIITLYRDSLKVPAELAGELSPAEEVSSPPFPNVEDAGEEDGVYLNVAEAGQKVLRIYRQMHHLRLVNYTYLATHNLFMAGISFLYAIWHSPLVRSRLTLDGVDFTILAATSVLGDLMHKCPPAEACKDAFERMSKATVQMCLSTTGFGSQSGTIRAYAGSTIPAPVTARQPGRARPAVKQRIVEHQRQKDPLKGQPPTPAPHSRISQTSPQFERNFPELYNDNNSNKPVPEQSSQMIPPYAQTEYSELVTRNFAPLQQGQQVSQARHPQRSQSMDYFPRYDNAVSPPSQPPPQQYYFSNSPQTASPGSSVTQSYGPAAGQQTQNAYQSIKPEPQPAMMSLDLLDIDSAAAPDQNLTVGSDSNPDYDTMMQGTPALDDTGGLGIDIGIGIAVDFQHDWSEAANYDLFEGYFFGGSGPAGAAQQQQPGDMG